MSVLRIIAGGLFALIASYIGLLIKRKYRDRAAFYKSACQYVSALQSELAHSKISIPEFAKRFVGGREGAFEKLLVDSIARLKDGKGYDELFKESDARLLKEDERKEMISFLSSSGKSSLDDQLASLAHYAAIFQDRYKKCEEDSKKLGGMYFKLFVLLGLAIILILA